MCPFTVSTSCACHALFLPLVTSVPAPVTGPPPTAWPWYLHLRFSRPCTLQAWEPRGADLDLPTCPGVAGTAPQLWRPWVGRRAGECAVCCVSLVWLCGLCDVFHMWCIAYMCVVWLNVWCVLCVSWCHVVECVWHVCVCVACVTLSGVCIVCCMCGIVAWLNMCWWRQLWPLTLCPWAAGGEP